MAHLKDFIKKTDFRHALICLAIVASVFYASYGFTNYLTSQRTHVPEIIFAWEYHIPFLSWTVVPYWTLNVFYALAFFLARTRAERYAYMKQLLFAQGVAIICFILFPLQFSWQKPETSGLFGELFASLATFDQPYNQAPSLHIILCVVVGRFYWQKLTSSGYHILRWAFLTWFLLIGGSVLTTYQHHFIDIPTGALVGFLTVWWFDSPRYYNSRSGLELTSSHKRWIVFYSMVAAFFAIGAFFFQGVWLWLLWISTSCILVTLAYLRFGAMVFQKTENGRLSLASTVLLLPYLLAVRVNIVYWLKGKACFYQITDDGANVFVGSILASRHFDATIDSVIDVCAEFPCLATPAYYQSIPMLDMVAPEHKKLSIAVNALQGAVEKRESNTRILVACALGYGRSVAVIIVWLVVSGRAKSLDEAVIIVKNKHPAMVVSASTRASLLRLINEWDSSLKP